MHTFPISEKDRENLKRLSISESRLEPLKDLCIQHNFDCAGWKILLDATIQLANFQQHYRPTIKSKSQRIKSLVSVQTAAETLQQELKNLDSMDALKIHNLLIECDGSGSNVPWWAKVEAVEDTCSIVADACRTLRESIEPKGTLGRKDIRPSLAGHIAAIAHQLKPYNFVPSEKGPFRRLCDTLFSVAGIPSSAEGAIKYFGKKMRVDMRARSMCL